MLQNKEAQLLALQHQHKGNTEQAQTLRQEIQALRDQNQKQGTTFEAQLKQKEQELQQLKQNGQSASAQAQQLQQEIQALRDQNEKQSLQFAALKAEYDKAMAAGRNLEQVNTKLSEALKQQMSNEQLQSLATQQHQLQAKMLEKNFEDAKTKLQAEHDKTRQDFVTYAHNSTQQLQALHATNTQLVADKNDLTTHLHKQTQQLELSARTTSRLQQVESELTNVNIMLHQKEEEMMQLTTAGNAALTEMEKKLQLLEKHIKFMEQKVAESEQNSLGWQGQATALHIALTQAQADLIQKEEQIKAMKEEGGRLLLENQNLRSLYSNLHQHTTLLHGHTTQLEQENTHLKHTLQQEQEHNRDLLIRAIKETNTNMGATILQQAFEQPLLNEVRNLVASVAHIMENNGGMTGNEEQHPSKWWSDEEREHVDAALLKLRSAEHDEDEADFNVELYGSNENKLFNSLSTFTQTMNTMINGLQGSGRGADALGAEARLNRDLSAKEQTILVTVGNMMNEAVADYVMQQESRFDPWGDDEQTQLEILGALKKSIELTYQTKPEQLRQTLKDFEHWFKLTKGATEEFFERHKNDVY